MHFVVLAVFLCVHVQVLWMCVCVSMCGCKVGWFAGMSLAFSVQGKFQCVGKEW